jgi:flagellar basal-body rod modification protein FlgD
MALDTLSAGTAASATSAAASTTATKKTGETNDAQGTQDRFLKMLVAQMKNQDPLNPMDNSAVTSQMAQLNTVSGIEKLNASMSAMANNYTSGTTLQATSLLGRTVMTEGSGLSLSGGQAKAAIELGQIADQVIVTVKNGAGTVIHTENLGVKEKGLHEITWDGKMDDGSTAPDGNYTFDISAKAAGQDAKYTSLAIAKVEGVTQATDGVHLLTDLSGEVKLADIKKIF